MFCPFIKGECVLDCIFNNGDYDVDNPDTCNLADAINIIQLSISEEHNPIKRLEDIEKKLSSIVFI